MFSCILRDYSRILADIFWMYIMESNYFLKDTPCLHSTWGQWRVLEGDPCASGTMAQWSLLDHGRDMYKYASASLQYSRNLRANSGCSQIQTVSRKG